MFFGSFFNNQRPFKFWMQLLPTFRKPLYFDILFVYKIFSWVSPQSSRYLNSFGVTVGYTMAGFKTLGKMTLGATVSETLLITYYFSALLQSQQSPYPSESYPPFSFVFYLIFLGPSSFSTLNYFLNFFIISTCSLSAYPKAFLISVLLFILDSLFILLRTCKDYPKLTPN